METSQIFSLINWLRISWTLKDVGEITKVIVNKNLYLIDRSKVLRIENFEPTNALDLRVYFAYVIEEWSP